MTVGLDTSVLLRLLTGLPAAQANRALGFVTKLFDSGGRTLISDLVLAEAYFALQHHYRVSKKDALEALRELLQAPGLQASGEAGEALTQPRLQSARPGFVDRMIHLQYLRAGAAEVVTFEKAAARLPQVRILTS